MVNTSVVLPAPGERVKVAWGRGSVVGGVVESYAGIRPRVVVEVDAQELGDNAVSVTVPLGAVEPLETTSSPWAEAARYERAVAAALARSLRKNLREIHLNAELDSAEVDILASMADGKKVIVEVKLSAPKGVAMKRLINRVSELAKSENAYALIVTPHKLPSQPVQSPRTSSVVWRDERDDSRLGEALKVLFSA